MVKGYTEKDEASTRVEIDQKLAAAGWLVQDKARMNLYDGEQDIHGVAVRETDINTGRADYMLFIDGKACGIVEAKREGASLGGVSDQSGGYAGSGAKFIKRWVPDGQPLPFVYECTNIQIRFRDERDPRPRSRYVFHFHQPKTLKNRLEEGTSLRQRLQALPGLETKGLRACQIEAIHGIEASLKDARPRALLQMATGSGKTFAAVTEVYRLAKFAKINRVLFLVDRGNLGRQALKEFQQYTVPNDGRKFTDLYNAHILGGAGIGDEIKVTISTIQRMYSQLSGQVLDDDADERSGFEVESASLGQGQREVKYNPLIPIESFDVIIIDECHRSIYNLWRQVLEYFDAFLIGLTATPTKKTIGFFNQNMVSEYTHENAVVDKVNVGYDIYRIKTRKSEEGDVIEAGTAVEIRDRLTKQKRLEILDEEEQYEKIHLDRSVIAPNQVRTIIKAFKDHALPECFPRRTWVPKTLIFAKDDDHADRIVDAVREVFDEGNDFCKKITYKVGKKRAEDAIAAFRTSPHHRIAVTVDMIATGTDIKPLECLLFMRDVRSQAYYEQMKGRGTRVLSKDEMLKVTPDAGVKTRFVLVDAVGVTETDKTETKSLEKKPSVSTEKLMAQIARGDRSPETLSTLGNRLVRLDLKLEPPGRRQLNELLAKDGTVVSNDMSVGADLCVRPVPENEWIAKDGTVMSTNSPVGADLCVRPVPENELFAQMAANLIRCANEDHLEQQAKRQFNTKDPTPEQIQAIYEPIANAMVRPFHNPDIREKIEILRRKTDQLIDDSADELTDAGYDKEKAQNLIRSFKKFIADNKDEIDALQLIYSQPYQNRHISYEQIEKLAEIIQEPPYNLAPMEVWKAYERLEAARVKGAPTARILTNLISLVNFATGLKKELEPFPKIVERRFNDWVAQQKAGGKKFGPEQEYWLGLIKEQIAQSAEMTLKDFEYTPFNQQGGLMKAREVFGGKLDEIISELNGYLIA